MVVLITIIFLIISFVSIDHLILWRRINNFERRAEDLVMMYNILLPKVKSGDSRFPNEEIFEYDGLVYKNVTVYKGDYNLFYKTLYKYAEDTLSFYNKIGDRYLSIMDDEYHDRIDSIYSSVEKILSTIRYQLWLMNGIE